MNHRATAPAVKSSAINSQSMPPCCGDAIPALLTGGLVLPGADFGGAADFDRAVDKLRVGVGARCAEEDCAADEAVLVGEEPANRDNAAPAARCIADPSDPSGLKQRPFAEALPSAVTARSSR